MALVKRRVAGYPWTAVRYRLRDLQKREREQAVNEGRVHRWESVGGGLCVSSYAVRCWTRPTSSPRLDIVRGKRAVVSLEKPTRLAGGWQVLFEAGPPQSVIGLTATCIPSLKSANRPRSLLSEAPVSQKLQRLCVPCAPSAESDDASLIHDHKFVSTYVFSVSTRLSRRRQAQNWGKKPLETTLDEMTALRVTASGPSYLRWIMCASSEVPHRSAPSSGNTSQGAFSPRKMCLLTVGGSHFILCRSNELIVNDTSPGMKE
jgi:hypothetical protein